MPDYVWDEYEQSVPMSTYLVAFVVSDFVNISSESRFSVWARFGAISQAKYALEIGPKCLRYFEEYFDIDFPLPKLDMIALPDFAAGAMENWGLITYRYDFFPNPNSGAGLTPVEKFDFPPQRDEKHDVALDNSQYAYKITGTW